MYGNQVGAYFNVMPPTFEQYCSVERDRALGTNTIKIKIKQIKLTFSFKQKKKKAVL